MAMDIVCQQSKTSFGNKYVFAFADWYTKSTRAIFVTKVTILYGAFVFDDIWVFSNGVATHQLTDNAAQFVSEFFAAV